jgi:3'-phosphoadenosine 5'-phosphosulfate sulfotransferase (PAPS reductase)/FAD synthetase
MQRVINFSGGKTSAYMTITEYREGDIVLFCDTGREHQKTYKFINDFEAHEGITVVRLAYSGGFEEMLSRRKTVPNQAWRYCTKTLKSMVARKSSWVIVTCVL